MNFKFLMENEHIRLHSPLGCALMCCIGYCYIPGTAHCLNADSDRMLYVQTTVLLLHFPSSGLVLSLYTMSLLQYHRDTFLYTWWVWSLFSIYCDIKQTSGTSYNNVLGKTINHVSPFLPLEEHMQFNVHSMFLYCTHAMLGPWMETPVGIKSNDFTLVHVA